MKFGFFFVIREETKDIIANPRELNQAVTFLHENGECCLCTAHMAVLEACGGQCLLNVL